MKNKLLGILFLFSVRSFAGGDSEEVSLLSLEQTSEEKYVLQYKSQKTNVVYTIDLSYSKLDYMLKARFLTHEKYVASIALLKEQLLQNKDVRFGWFGSGPCVIDKAKNHYRSDALEIYEEGSKKVVYAFCEYS